MALDRSAPTGNAGRPAVIQQEEERLAWLRLLRSRRVGVTTFFRLLAEHGSARAALRALPSVARAAGIEDYAPCPEGVALAEYRRGLAQGARLLLRGDADYPPALALLPDAPPLLWALGDVALLSRPMVALVGSRNASSLGLRMARSLAAGLGEKGFVIVSGLARGIDTATHEAALPTGTVAVMAGGVDHIYPPENAGLAARIAEQGLRLSEHPVGMEPQARHFPARNRIIAGLSLGVVVVEAAERSGSLITARQASDQGREVMAVPGHPLDPRASGCNTLIRDGATLVRSAADVEEALAPALAGMRWGASLPAPAPASGNAPCSLSLSPPPAVAAPSSAPTRATDLRSRILERLGPSPLAEDQLIRDLAIPFATVAPVLLDLEIEGLIRRQPGGLLARGG
ncbi:DNA protecting protein DprA [Rubellimicrobium thermophilum DSM 16684]|uniref:DNA protecting protein DprA n=1 Tax=Rubellimicrobium thermophilum DSM 16684 TaxID=1123069 RepID=S9SLS8_9RHOB|nr:DNA-processing protein DprA [Rubellimicrobium thermophilum]EPX87379.1 DNA protecting protein DprA [Rubellimicrobium thermophilum DSM 16684]